MFGALAQLGARHNGIVEATGSNPVCSIFKANLLIFIRRFVVCFNFIFSRRSRSTSNFFGLSIPYQKANLLPPCFDRRYLKYWHFFDFLEHFMWTPSCKRSAVKSFIGDLAVLLSIFTQTFAFFWHKHLFCFFLIR